MEIQLLNIKRGRFDDHYEEMMQDLSQLHWEEIARNKHLMVLNPDYDRFIALENAGLLIVLYAYDDDKLIGYSHTLLFNHLHYKDLLVAHNDLLFIHPDFRRGSVGIKLIKETEKAAKQAGAKLMTWHAKENTSLDKILPKLGNKVQEIIYSKEL